MYKFTGTSPANGVSLTMKSGDRNIDGLYAGNIWDSINLTYAIPVTSDYYSSPYKVGPTTDPVFVVNNVFIDNFVPATAARQTVYEKALASISEFSQLKFTKAPDHIRADLALGTYTPQPSQSGGVGFPPISRQAGDLWLLAFNGPLKIGDVLSLNTFHELGHTLGLGHGHELLDPNRNSMEFTVMTYYNYIGYTFEDNAEQYGNPQTFMMLDIATLQFMYGANFTSNAGNNVYTFNSATGEMSIDGVGQGVPGANRIFRTIWDGNGKDTYDLSNYTTNLKIDLNPGGWSVFSTEQLAELGDGVYARGNVFNALQYEGDARSLIENAIGGSGNDTITGNSANNSLYGKAGHDTLIGGTGADSLYGGANKDVHDGGEGIDIANYGDADYGNLTISLDVNIANRGEAAVGDTYISIEGLAGGNGVDFIFGDGNANYLYGAKGNDVLNAGDGNDNLYGGWGADNHIGGNGIDLARYDDQNFGNLTIYLGNPALNKGDAAVGDKYTGIEGLVAGAGNDTVVGDLNDNYLYGQGGNDIIRGLLGNDTLFGGAGADQFKFDTGITAKPNVDVIKDFDTNADKIALSTIIFGKIAKTLDADEFVTGDKALAFNDYIIYKQTTGALFYDADGTGAGEKIHFATITPNTVLTYEDFVMFSY